MKRTKSTSPLAKPGKDRSSSPSRVPGVVRVGCAGWSVSGPASSEFPLGGTHLQRYARRFPAVEINSSFYRPHKPATYQRWGESVPEDFRFAVKIPKVITHELRLVGAFAAFDTFLSEVRHLGDRLAFLLVQLPPKLSFESDVACAFLDGLRERHHGGVAIEPRHASWFTDDVNRLLAARDIVRVAADPAPVPAAAMPGGHRSQAYFRLHGSPRMYYSSYTPEYLQQLSGTLREAAVGGEAWCMFDNTASGAAVPNALELTQLLHSWGERP